MENLSEDRLVCKVLPTSRPSGEPYYGAEDTVHDAMDAVGQDAVVNMSVIFHFIEQNVTAVARTSRCHQPVVERSSSIS